ncbi:MAG TPA: hypothetical protein ENH56_08510 [Roseobacter sp.]|uniref:Uncharacterized protein n=1 Tax=marine sediment metagenome TaxID=412755 RepID=A0A0F9RBD6_9ZZZZ|nr:hypothetical protein [Roseobacter sp.]
MDGLTNVFLDEGILGAIIVALGIVVVTLYRQNQALQKEARDTLREVIPAIAALDKALDSVQRGSIK